MLQVQRPRETCAAVPETEKQPRSPSPVYSLQDKLDRIAHERDVLALQRELARDGLREGDAVRQVGGEASGRLLIDRNVQPPRLCVRADDGTLTEYSPVLWRRP